MQCNSSDVGTPCIVACRAHLLGCSFRHGATLLQGAIASPSQLVAPLRGFQHLWSVAATDDTGNYTRLHCISPIGQRAVVGRDPSGRRSGLRCLNLSCAATKACRHVRTLTTIQGWTDSQVRTAWPRTVVCIVQSLFAFADVTVLLVECADDPTGKGNSFWNTDQNNSRTNQTADGRHAVAHKCSW